MKSAGDYALLVANGMKFADAVELIREEVLLDLSCDCAALELDAADEEHADGEGTV